MADDLTQRSFRLSDRPARPKTSSGADPLAELARLIGQTDPFGEFGREQARTARPGEPAGELRAPRVAAALAEWSMPPAPAVDWSAPPAPVPGYPPKRVHVSGPAVAPIPEPMHDDAPHADNDAREHSGEDASIAPPDGEHDDFYEHEEPRRRTGMIAIAAVFALAIIGTAGAFGYRALFGNSGTVPPVIKADPTPIKVEAAKNPSIKTSQERVPGPGEKLVSREEKPIELKDKVAGTVLGGQVNPPAAAPPAAGAISTEPKKIHTISIRPDGAVVDPGVAPSAPPASAAPPVARVPTPPSRPPVAEPPQQRVVQAAPRNGGPLSLNPNAAPAPPAARPAPAPAAAPAAAAPAVPPAAAPVAASGYAVQLSSQRSEAEAQAAFRSLQAKFPNQLRTQQAMIRRVELGEKGVYFRAMVGPFGSSDEAIKLCTSLKSAGGSCIVQKI